MFDAVVKYATGSMSALLWLPTDASHSSLEPGGGRRSGAHVVTRDDPIVGASSMCSQCRWWSGTAAGGGDGGGGLCRVVVCVPSARRARELCSSAPEWLETRDGRRA